jgi:hypothetical protein
MRPSIPILQDAQERFILLHEIHALGRSAIHLHKDEMQAPSEPSTAPHFAKGDKRLLQQTLSYVGSQT